MENKITAIKKLMIVLLAVVSTHVFAQTYPISNINISLPSYPDPNTANWSAGRSRLMIMATSGLSTGRVDPDVAQSKLLVIITQGGTKVCGDYNVYSAPPANFNTVNKIWNGNNAVSFLGRGCILPPGDYEITVQFFGYNNGKTIALSDEKTKTFSIQGSNNSRDQQQGILNPATGVQPRQANVRKPGERPNDAVNPGIEPQTKPTDTRRPGDQQPDASNPVVEPQTKPAGMRRPGDQRPDANNPVVEPQTKPTDNRKPGDQRPGANNPVAGTDTRPTDNRKPGDLRQGANNPVVEPQTKPADNRKPGDQRPGGNSPVVEPQTKPTDNTKPGDQRPGVNNPPGETETRPTNTKKPGLLGRLGKIAANSTGFTGNININLSSPAACGCGSWSPITINRNLKIDCGSKNIIQWKCTEPFDFLSTYNCNSKDKGCQAVTAWEIKKDGVSIVAGQGDHNITGEFIPQTNGIYTLTLTASCNGQKCEPCNYTIAIEDCKTCDCGTWGPLTVNNTARYQTGYKNTIPWKCSQPFNFTSTYRCGTNNQGCQAITSWAIAKGGAVIKTGEGNTEIADAFTPTANGTYTITLNADCGGAKCAPAIYSIVVEDCKTCDCGTWGPLTVNNTARYQSGYKNTIPWKCSQPLSFASTYRCGTNNQSCQAATNWAIAKDGAVIKTGEGNIEIADAFTPTANGTYTITLNADCGGTICAPAVYTIVVEDCKTCDCGTWGPLTVNNTARYQSGYKNTIPWKCSQPLSFASTYRCGTNNQSCQAATNWAIAKDGAVIKTGEGNIEIADAFTPTANGTYTITLNADCGGAKCAPAVYTIVVEDCKTCDCGAWSDQVVNIRTNGKVVSAVKFGETATLTAGNYRFFIPDFVCSPKDTSCAVSYSWSVQGGAVTKNGIDQKFNYNFSRAGIYTINVIPSCGGKQCPPAKIQVKVGDVSPPPPSVETQKSKKQVGGRQAWYYVIRPEYSGEVVYAKDTLFLQIDNNYSSGSNQLTYVIRNLSNSKTSRSAKLAITNNQGLIRIALPLQNSVVQRGETGALIMNDFKKYYYISFKRN